MNWRSLSLAAGVAGLIGAAVSFTYDGPGWVAWACGIAGAAAAILGLVPDQLLIVFKIPELRKKILITLIFLAVYRIGYYVPLPMIDQVKMAEKMAAAQTGALGQVLGFVSLFSGGNLSSACIFSMGIMPYISASIIIQLLSSGVLPSLERLRKEGEAGRKKINEITRYLTVPICVIQAIIILQSFMRPDTGDGSAMGLTPEGYRDGFNLWWFGFVAVVTMTTGTVFLMWLGEQIDEYGIGNGISLIIMAGIVARIPDATNLLLVDGLTGKLKDSVTTLGGAPGEISFEKLIVMAFIFVAVVVGVIAMTKAQRRIPTQSAKHVRGRRVYGGTRQFLPMKVNAAGVMPVIFASTLLIVPYFLFNIIATQMDAPWAASLTRVFQKNSGWVYNVLYVAMIYVFTYFWVAITFNPKEIADNLKDHGSFIPGYRPGKKTADYLERVLMRVTFVGAAFLAVIAIIPNVISSEMEIPIQIANFYGGTGLLIVISVALDLVQKINSHLVMRNYPGLTDE
jgi:preprotein translocase subunit SecY